MYEEPYQERGWGLRGVGGDIKQICRVLSASKLLIIIFFLGGGGRNIDIKIENSKTTSDAREE